MSSIRRISRPGLSRRDLLKFSLAAAAAVALRVQTTEAGAPLQVRRDARTLSRRERRRLTEAVKGMKWIPSSFDPDDNAYDYFVRMHYYAARDPGMPAHMAASFAPWHRYFGLLFEQELQRVDPEVTVPYWDWTVDQGREASIWAQDFMGGEGDPDDRWIVKTGPFRQGEWSLSFVDPESDDQDGTIFDLQRQFGVHISGGEPTTRLPSAAEIADALALSTYDVDPWNDHSDPTVSFRSNLEGFRFKDDGTRMQSQNHNRVHNWVGGAMSADASPNDPVFWMHHNMVDMIWAAWQARWNGDYQPQSGARMYQNLTDPLWHLGGPTIQMALDHRALGYVYDRELTDSLSNPWWAALAGLTPAQAAQSRGRPAPAHQASAVALPATDLFRCILGPSGY